MLIELQAETIGLTDESFDISKHCPRSYINA